MVGKLSANVIETPGHTKGHISYWFHADKLAFVGDTLFPSAAAASSKARPA